MSFLPSRPESHQPTIQRMNIFSQVRLWPAAACLALAMTTHAQPSAPLKPGDPAPAFEGQDQNGKSVKLADFAGKRAVLLYFYPKDNTPGCTKQSCGFRDQMDAFKQNGVEVIGVSFDDAASHRKFIADHNLNFNLLADTDGTIAGLFGAKMKDRNLARRVSFLIGKDGRIAHITDNPSADVHLSEMKEATARLAR